MQTFSLRSRFETLILAAVLIWAAAVGGAHRVQAQTPAAAAKPDPAGTWKWTTTTGDGQTFESVMVIKQDAGKLSGTVTGRGGGESPLLDLKLTGDQISFRVVRERDGQRFERQFAGKLAGHAITGTVEFERDGEKRSREWLAKRDAATAQRVDLSGTWKWKTGFNGQEIEITYRIKQEGDRLTGASILPNGNETPLLDGLLKDGDVSFRTARELDGRTIAAKYKAKLDGGMLRGTVTSNVTGDEQTRDWEASKAQP